MFQIVRILKVVIGITKLSYPDNGLKNLIYNNLDNAEAKLANAGNHYLSIPSFKYSSYLGSLNREIYDYRKRISAIKSSVVYVNNLYNELADDLETRYKNLPFSTLKERERTIK